MRAFVLVAFLLFVSVNATYFGSKTYDHIHIGLGGMGSYMVHEISAEPDISVLAIDVGEACGVECAADGANFVPNNVHYVTPLPKPQEFCSIIRQPFHASYQGPGGSSKLFGGVYVRPTPEWLTMKMSSEFDYAHLLPYYKKYEHHFCCDNPQSVTGISPAECAFYHGCQGDMYISPQAFNNISPAIRDLNSFLGSTPFGFTSDYNVANKRRGASYEMNYRKMANLSDIYSGRQRWDAEAAFLNASVLARPNLDVILNARVTRIIFDRRGEASRIEYCVNGNDCRTVNVGYSVGISLGVLGTPQLLQLSGVGSEALLRKFGIDLVYDNPEVGNGLSSSQAVMLSYKTKTPINHNFTTGPYNVADWFLQTGFTPNLQADSQVEILEGFGPTNLESPANGLPQEMLQLLMSGDMSPDYISFHVEIHDTKTKGKVEIRSSDPGVAPMFDFNWTIANILTSVDFPKILTALAMVRSVTLGDNPWANTHIDYESWPGDYFKNTLRLLGYNESSVGIPPFGLDFNTHAAVMHLQSLLHPIFHLTGSCQMGKCVDLRGKVIGVKKVYACDNSLFDMPDGNPSAHGWAVCGKISHYIIDDVLAAKARARGRPRPPSRVLSPVNLNDAPGNPPSKKRDIELAPRQDSSSDSSYDEDIPTEAPTVGSLPPSPSYPPITGIPQYQALDPSALTNVKPVNRTTSFA